MIAGAISTAGCRAGRGGRPGDAPQWLAQRVAGKRSEFSDAIARGKLLADAEVANKLYQRVCGYAVSAVQPCCQDVARSSRPNTQAASLWLRNRQPQRWRGRHEVDVADNRADLMDGMTEDQLIERLLQRREMAQRKPS